MTRTPRQPADTRAALIVGCGYLGRRLAQALVSRGQVVYGTTRHQNRTAALADLGVRPLLLSVTQPLTFASLTPALTADSLDVYLMVPPGRLDGSPPTRHVVLGGTAHLLKSLRRANVRRAVMVSSSAVYGQTDGERVDADTPAHPTSERTRLMLKGERLWLDAGPAFSVLRLAGLYGPGRIVGLRALRQRAPLLGDPQALLNLIYLDDAVSLLIALAEREPAARFELGCDGRPVPRIEYYRDLAQRLNLPGPQAVDDQTAAALYGLNAERLARSSNKALDNAVTRRRSGWAPAVADYRAGLDLLIRPAEQAGPKIPTQPC